MSIAVNDLAGAYRKLLTSMNVTPQSDDLLVQTIDGIDKQVLVDGKPLALPTSDIVNNYSDSIVLFHPLCENLLLGESPVLQELRALVMEFINDRTLHVVESILSIAVDNDLMKELSPTQMEFMRAASGADATTLKNWQAIMRRAESRGSTNRVLTFYLKRGAELDGTVHKRVAIVNFNLYHELQDGSLNIFGTKIRKTDTKVYSKILEAIFEDIFTIDKYSAGSNTLTAPYFDALIKAYHNVLKSLNGVSWNLRKPIKQTTGLELHVKDDFIELFKDLIKYRDVLPTMPLNDGDRQTRRNDDQPQESIDVVPIPANDLPGMSSLTRQSSPYYEPKPVVVDVPVEPVQQPQYHQQQGYQQPPQQQPMGNTNFPSLQEQLSGVPIGGYMQQPYPQQYNNFQPPPPAGYGGYGQPMQPQFNNNQGYWNPQQNFNPQQGYQPQFNQQPPFNQPRNW